MRPEKEFDTIMIKFITTQKIFLPSAVCLGVLLYKTEHLFSVRFSTHPQAESGIRSFAKKLEV